MNATKTKLETIYGKNWRGKYFTIIKTYDDNACNPRGRDNIEYLSRFYIFERDKNSPDSHNYRSFKDWADHNGIEVGESPEDLVKSMSEKGYIALPVWKYEHDNHISYSAAMNNPYHCAWDSNIVGVIYVACDKLKGFKEFSTKDDVFDMLKDEVNEYSKYVNGELCIYELYDADNNFVDDISEELMKDFCEGTITPEKVCEFFHLHHLKRDPFRKKVS